MLPHMRPGSGRQCCCTCGPAQASRPLPRPDPHYHLRPLVTFPTPSPGLPAVQLHVHRGEGGRAGAHGVAVCGHRLDGALQPVGGVVWGSGAGGALWAVMHGLGPGNQVSSCPSVSIGWTGHHNWYVRAVVWCVWVGGGWWGWRGGGGWGVGGGASAEALHAARLELCAVERLTPTPAPCLPACLPQPPQALHRERHLHQPRCRQVRPCAGRYCGQLHTAPRAPGLNTGALGEACHRLGTPRPSPRRP